MGPVRDIEGKRFGRLVCIEPAHKIGDNYYWKCQCDCGCIVYTRRDNLLRGETQSCGCLRAEKSRERWIKNGERWRASRKFNKPAVV